MQTGSLTPNIGIYIPAAGEDGYSEDFASGMVNVDQHDHSGGPNKGMPIATEGLGAFSVTFDKLATNVVDPSTGVGTSGVFLNQIVMLDPLKAIFSLAPATGFITMDGTLAHVRTFTDSGTITWTNANGASGNPSAAVNLGGIFPVNVADGGTGKTSFAAWDIICGGTTTTGPLQQVSGEGVADQYLASAGPAQLPIWKTLPTIPPQTLFQATVTMTASQFRNLDPTYILIIPAQGAGKVAVPISATGKVFVSTTPFAGGSSVRFYYGVDPSSLEAAIRFETGCFDSSGSGYYQANSNTPPTAGIDYSDIENTAVYISVNSTNFSGGGVSSTVTITVFYTVIEI